MTFRSVLKSVAAGLCLASLSAGLFSLTAAAGPAKGSAAAAKPIFASKCVACHKADGSGGIKLTGNPTPNWKLPKTWADPKRNDDFLRDCITNGKVKSGMVAWGKTGQLKPQQIEDLIVYINATFKPKK